MEKINVWIDKAAFNALKSDEPKAVIVQNRLDLELTLAPAAPNNAMIHCELMSLTPIRYEDPLEPIGHKKLVLNVESRKNFTDNENQIIDEATRIYNIVVNHPLYWKKIKDNWSKVTEANGHTFESFKELFLSGDCNFTEADGETNVQIIMYNKRWSKVVGYVYSNQSNLIHINRKYFSNALGIASNLNHEALHLMGFSHYGTHSTSIPYLIGNTLFQDTWKQIIKEAA